MDDRKEHIPACAVCQFPILITEDFRSGREFTYGEDGEVIDGDSFLVHVNCLAERLVDYDGKEPLV